MRISKAEDTTRAANDSYLYKFSIFSIYKHVLRFRSFFRIAKLVPVLIFDNLFSVRIPLFAIKVLHLSSKRFLLPRSCRNHDLLSCVEMLEQYSFVVHHVLLGRPKSHGLAGAVRRWYGEGALEPLG